MKPAASLLAVTFLTACTGEPAAEGSAHGLTCSGDAMIVTDAWMRPARTGQPTSAAYLTLCNGASGDDTLVSVSFAGASAAELHITRIDSDGVASMTPSPSISITSGKTTILEPGGAHIMLIGLNAPLTPGETHAATLEFETAPSLTVEFEVRSESYEGGAHH